MRGRNLKKGETSSKNEWGGAVSLKNPVFFKCSSEIDVSDLI